MYRNHRRAAGLGLDDVEPQRLLFRQAGEQVVELPVNATYI
jgi:hypothetical protein